MTSAEIITIGTEILLGEIVDTNSRYIARQLREVGLDLFRNTTVGDNVRRIANVIQGAMERCEVIITTGGLGPTVDDPTREAIASALDLELEFRSELWNQIKTRFQKYGRQPTENNKRQAYVPSGALALENPVGTAPAFIIEQGNQSIIALPGVPREMEFLMGKSIIPYLTLRYILCGTIMTRILHTAGVGESMIDERIDDLEKLANPTVGLSAHSGQVDIRITAKGDSKEQAEILIQGVEGEIRQRLGDWIYGADQVSIEEVVLGILHNRNWTLAVVEAGLGGELTRRLASASGTVNVKLSRIFKGGEVLASISDSDTLMLSVENSQKSQNVDVCLGVAIQPVRGKHKVHIALVTPESRETFTYYFGGPPEYAPQWALHYSLNMLRRLKKNS